MTLKEILRWPENKRTGLVPWFVIAWRCVWIGPIYATKCLMFLLVLAAYGAKNAAIFWETCK